MHVDNRPEVLTERRGKGRLLFVIWSFFFDKS